MSSEKKKKKFPIIILAIATFALAVAGGYFYQVLKNKDESNSSIVKVEDDGTEKGTVDASLTYAGYATLSSEEKLITLNFTNPAKSKKSLSIEIVADINGEEISLAKSDKIDPGYKIDSIKYELDREMPTGSYKGKFIVYFYDDKGKEEIVNSEIAINIYVK